MKIMIAGNGKVGTTLTRQLSAEGYEITLVDTDPVVLEAIADRYDVMTVQGNCASMEVLRAAGIQSTDLLIAVTNADEINLLCCVTAHQINPDLHTIARIRNPEYSGQVYSMADAFALSLSVNPERQAAIEIERLLQYPGFLQRDTFIGGRAVIVELRLDEGSILNGQALKNMAQVTGCNVLICAVLRDGKAIAPDGNFTLRQGDRIFVTAPTEELASLLKSMGIITRRVRQVMICGGGRVSFYLAQLLIKSGMEITIVEQDPARCLSLTQQLPKAHIVLGDASSQDLLDSEGLRRMDAVVSVTGLDELNLVISLYASKQDVPHIITKMAHMENPQILSDLPLGSIINPKMLCSGIITRYVRALKNKTGAATSVHTIADGQVEAAEFRLDETSLHCGEPLRQLTLKKNVLIACISHGAKTEIPNGSSCFRQGDNVIVVAVEGSLNQFNDIFEE